MHTPKPRGYKYQPVFYNPEEDKKAEERQATANNDNKFRWEMESRWKTHRRQSRANNIQLMIYLLIILGLLYFIFFVW